MSPTILQSRLPFAPWMDPRTARLPGILPVEGLDWLRVDDAFAGQMAERDARIAATPDLVHALLPEAEPVQTYLLPSHQPQAASQAQPLARGSGQPRLRR